MIKNKDHDFTFFNEEWNYNDDQSQYIDGVDERPKQNKTSTVED